MEDIQQRLRATADACITSYDAWSKNKKEGGVRETLMEAVHELRKVAARLEIEIAVNERDEMASRPIPIPPHRASRKPGGDVPDDNIGNEMPSDDQQPQSFGSSGGQGGGGAGPSHRDRLRRRPHRSGGGGQGGGGQGG